jgi:putative transcriptional regulator
MRVSRPASRTRRPSLTALLATTLLGVAAAFVPRPSAAPAVADAVQPAARVVAAAAQLAVDLAPGKLLVARRALGDPNFAGTVILLFSYAKDGAAGLIVNRPTTLPLAQALPDLPIPKGQQPTVFFGGPVAATVVRALVRSPAAPKDGLRLLTDVYLLATAEAVDAAVADGVSPDRIRLFGGYAGWGAGQLESEILHGDWFLMDGTGDIVFDAHPEEVWRRCLSQADVIAL